MWTSLGSSYLELSELLESLFPSPDKGSFEPAIISSNNSLAHSLKSPSGDPYNMNDILLEVVPNITYLHLKKFFSSCCCSVLSSLALSSSSPISFLASFTLLLCPSVFLVPLKFTVWTFLYFLSLLWTHCVHPFF